MDVSEQKYKKILNEYKQCYNNLISEYPISSHLELSPIRNLHYISKATQAHMGYPYTHPLYQEIAEQIKHQLEGNSEERVLAVRLARTIPFTHRVKFIEENENELTAAINTGKKQPDQPNQNNYGSQMAADITELLLSVYQLTHQSEDIYFDVNQKILSIFSRLIEQTFSGERHQFRNGCQILRSIFNLFGAGCNKKDQNDNKLINKLINTFIPSSSFVTKPQNSMGMSQLVSGGSSSNKNNSKLLSWILKCREFEARMRPRMLHGFCMLLSYLGEADVELVQIILKEIVIVMQNINECDVNLQSFGCLRGLLCQQLPFHIRNNILKKWASLLHYISYKKQYLEYYIFILDYSNNNTFAIPFKLRYFLAISCLELTKNVQQQYTRFILYRMSCYNIMSIARSSYQSNKSNCSILLNIFQYSWFIDRINLQNDLFKSELLIFLLHAFYQQKGSAIKEEVVDLIGLCHRLIDWKCASKEETHIPTLKFAFDLYLRFLETASAILNNHMQPHIVQLIERCNQQSIYFLFKLKLIGTLIILPWYQTNSSYLQKTKLHLQFIEGQIRPFMMPKNPKPIFDYQYSLSIDGQIESRKQIQSIKIIINLLSQISKVHENVEEQVTTIIVDYHQYLSELEVSKFANKDLINCLQALEADHYLTECQRNVLLALIKNESPSTYHNFEMNLDNNIVSSFNQRFECEDQINIFGPMSSIQLTIKLVPHQSYSSVYIHIKKNQWVLISSPLKLIISSGVQKKQIPFQSSIVQIRIDRIGALHFQVWSIEETQLLLGSGSYKIKRHLKWKKVNHLKIIDGIRTKAFFKELSQKDDDSTFLSYFYGQPILIQILKSKNEIVVSVSTKEIWTEVRQAFLAIVEELAEGSAQIIEYE